MEQESDYCYESTCQVSPTVGHPCQAAEVDIYVKNVKVIVNLCQTTCGHKDCALLRLDLDVRALKPNNGPSLSLKVDKL